MRNLPTAGACCAACAANEQCHTWTLASNDKPPKCSLKGALTGKLHVGTKRGFTTGTRQAPPSPAPPPHPPADHHWAVFTAAEIKQCGDIRIPELTRTPSRILLFAQCRSANSSRSSTAAGKDRGALRCFDACASVYFSGNCIVTHPPPPPQFNVRAQALHLHAPAFIQHRC